MRKLVTMTMFSCFNMNPKNKANYKRWIKWSMCPDSPKSFCKRRMMPATSSVKGSTRAPSTAACGVKHTVSGSPVARASQGWVLSQQQGCSASTPGKRMPAAENGAGCISTRPELGERYTMGQIQHHINRGVLEASQMNNWGSSP